MNCEQSRNRDLVEKYVTGQLPEPDMSAFEEHYFGCDECLEAVQLGQAIVQGNAGKSGGKVISMPPPPVRQRLGWAYGMAAAAAAAVVVTVIGWRVLLSPSPAGPVELAHQPSSVVEIPVAPNPAPVVTKPVEPATSEPVLLASNLELGSVTPLPYRPSVLRGSSEDSSQRFHLAMLRYLQHDYRQAEVALAAIPVAVPASGKADEHVTDAGVQLYLGISQLMLNRNGDAIRSLRRAQAYGDTPYIENADFYLAKALIRQKKYAEAAGQLRQVVGLNGDRLKEAQQLLDQVNQIQGK